MQDVKNIWEALIAGTGDWELVQLCYERGLPWHAWAATGVIGSMSEPLEKLRWMHSVGCPFDGARLCVNLCALHA